MSEKLKVAVLGCGGILGQYLMISVPEDIEPLFVRKTPSPLAESLDLTDYAATEAWLKEHRPDVIVNLAGESRPDVVERDGLAYEAINIGLPARLRVWCEDSNAHLITVSSQAALDPVNIYGRQKALVDSLQSEHETIVRPTFVLGIRPFPAIGRENPAESILRGDQHDQVDDRFFSVSFAWDVADLIWSAARKRSPGPVIHVGNPERLCRYDLARLLNPAGHFIRRSHQQMADMYELAPRPLDAAYVGAHFETPLADGLQRLRAEYMSRSIDNLTHRSRELAAFLRLPHLKVEQRLLQGFGPLHNEVTADFNRAAPKADDELLNWYRTTDAYLWELTAYHCDAGFNYSGMCEGIITRLKHAATERKMLDGPQLHIDGVRIKPPSDNAINPMRVLCLGDGVGTLTIKMKEAGLAPVYHDLAGSRTSMFAQARFAMRFKDAIPERMSITFEPPVLAGYDAVCSLDYLEHVPNVDEWVRAIWAALKPGGLFVAQNAFNCGSGPDGAIPQHLAVNDHWEKDWDPLLASIGFVQLASNWYLRP